MLSLLANWYAHWRLDQLLKLLTAVHSVKHRYTV